MGRRPGPRSTAGPEPARPPRSARSHALPELRTPDKRPLGTTGLRIAPLVLGGNVFGWTVDEPTSFSILDAFVDAGFDAVDTADAYSS